MDVTQPAARPSSLLRFILGSLLSAALLVLLTTVLGIDISAWRDFERDAFNLSAPRGPSDVDLYADPSPYSLWLPSDVFVWDSIRRGELPFWNRLQGGGYSPLLVMQEGVLHPLRWLTALVPREMAATALILFALAVAAAGTYALTRFELGYAVPAAAAASAAFTLSPLLISFAQFSGALLPLAHVPWIVLFLRRGGGRGTLAVLAILFALLLLSGHPLLIACALATVGLMAIVESVAARAIAPFVRAAAGGALGLLLAAPAYLPPLLSWSELWTYKTRTGTGHSYIIYTFTGWLRALRAIVVDVFPRGKCCLDLDEYFLYVGIPALALIAAGVAAAIRSRHGRVLLWATLAAFAIAVPGPWMSVFIRLFSFFKPWYLGGAFAFLAALLLGAGCDLLWRSGRRIRWVAIALTAATVLLYASRAGLVLRPRIVRPSPPSATAEFLSRQREPFRVFSLWGQNHLPNSSALTGVEDFRIAQPILPLRYHWWWQLADPDVMTRSFPTTRVTDRVGSPLFRDFNIRFVLEGRLFSLATFRSDPDESRRDPHLWPSIDALPLEHRTPWLNVRRVPDAAPRAHFAPAIVTVPDLPAAVELVQRQPSILSGRAVVEADLPLAVPPQATGTVVVRYPGSAAVELDVDSPTGGLVVLHDTFAGGWAAEVDGESAAIHPVNILSRGVIVGAGRHRIRMQFTPPGLAASVAISIAAMLLLLLVELRRSRVQAGS